MQAFICDAIRTPIGRYGGALAGVRADDLGAIPLKALMARNPQVDWAAVTDVLYGCANQAGEDNRNVARMALLLAGLPVTIRLVDPAMDQEVARLDGGVIGGQVLGIRPPLLHREAIGRDAHRRRTASRLRSASFWCLRCTASSMVWLNWRRNTRAGVRHTSL